MPRASGETASARVWFPADFPWARATADDAVADAAPGADFVRDFGAAAELGGKLWDCGSTPWELETKPWSYVSGRRWALSAPPVFPSRQRSAGFFHPTFRARVPWAQGRRAIAGPASDGARAFEAGLRRGPDRDDAVFFVSVADSSDAPAAFSEEGFGTYLIGGGCAAVYSLRRHYCTSDAICP